MMLCILLLAGVGIVAAQVPGFGGCPDFESQKDFDMNKFLGTWYEAERYVNIFEAGTRCVKTNYTRAVDGRYLVANEIMSRFTSVKRVLEGEIRLLVKGSESKMNVKYPNFPIPYESQFLVLDTDYDSYSVMWSCSSLGIINTQNAWIMTREKLAPGTVLQKAYNVLDKYKLSKTFFYKTEQNSCEIAEASPDKAAPSDSPVAAPPAAPAPAAPAPAAPAFLSAVPAPVAPAVPAAAPATAPVATSASAAAPAATTNKRPNKKGTQLKKGTGSEEVAEEVVADVVAPVSPVVETADKRPIKKVVLPKKGVTKGDAVAEGEVVAEPIAV